MASDTSPSSARASVHFEAWLDQLESDVEAPFEDVVARHPECADELRRLHAQWSRLATKLDSALPGPLLGESFFRASVAEGALGEGAATGNFAEKLANGDEPAAPEPPPPEPGRVLGDYRLLRLIAQGGMGSVWEAEQLSLRRRVALKLLRPGRGAPRLLHREARAAGRLDHPGVVPVFAVGEADGLTFIAQQLVGDGFTLADFLERAARATRLPPDYDRRIARLIADVAEAVHAAHEAGVLHRDLKPRNILIDDEDRPRVTDFGLAHVTEIGGDIARPGVLGTVAYMSPEQVGGRDIEIDRRSDVFGLGAVLWEALTLRRAFEGDTPQAVLERVLHEEPPDARSLRSRVPRDLAVIAAKALRKPRSLRYASLRELADDLRRFLRNEPIRAQPERLAGRTWKWVLRHPAWSASLALGATALVAISILLLREIDARRLAQEAGAQARVSARMADERAAEARRQSYLANLRAASAALEQGGLAEALRLLAACPPEHRGWEWSHLERRAQAVLLDLSGHTAAVLAAAITPDGRRLVTGCADGTLHVWDGESGARLGVLTGHRGAVTGVALSADGTRAFSAGADGSVRAWDLRIGRPLAVQQGPRAPLTALAASADGLRVAFAGEDGLAQVWVPATDALLTIEPLPRTPLASLALDAAGRRLALGSRYGTLDVFDAENGAHLNRLALYEGPDAPVALSPDGERLASGAGDGALLVRDVETGELLLIIEAHAAAVAALAWSADGSRLVSVSGADHLPRVWDARSGAALGERRGHEGRVDTLALDGSGRRIVAGGSGGHAWVWLSDEGDTALALPRLAGQVTALAADASGALLLAAGLGGGGAQILNGLSGATRATLALGPGPAALALDSQGRLAVSVSLQDEVVRLWNPRDGRPLGTLAGPRGGMTTLSLSADGTRLLAAAQDGRLHVWELPSRRALPVLVGHASIVSAATLSADGRRAASASVDGTVRVWDVDRATSRVLSEAGWFEDALVALSADGTRVASASLRGDTVTVWDADSGERLSTLAGHGNGVGALLLSHDGTRAFSASARDAALRVWDATRGDLLVRLTGHSAPITALALSGDGVRVYSGDRDGGLLVWESEPAR